MSFCVLEKLFIFFKFSALFDVDKVRCEMNNLNIILHTKSTLEGEGQRQVGQMSRTLRLKIIRMSKIHIGSK